MKPSNFVWLLIRYIDTLYSSINNSVVRVHLACKSLILIYFKTLFFRRYSEFVMVGFFVRVLSSWHHFSVTLCFQTLIICTYFSRVHWLIFAVITVFIFVSAEFVVTLLVVLVLVSTFFVRNKRKNHATKKRCFKVFCAFIP